jgi:hypothetical protein
MDEQKSQVFSAGIATRAMLGSPAMARRSGSRKRAAFDGAAGNIDPGVVSLGRESDPINPKEEARQRASEAGSRPSLPAENAGTGEQCSEGL